MEEVASKSISKDPFYQKIIEDFGLLPEAIDRLASTKAAIRYGCGKVLIDLSEAYPEKLHPYMGAFVSHLGSNYLILVWNSLAIIANICTVDGDKHFDGLFDKYYRFINDEHLVTVTNVMEILGK